MNKLIIQTWGCDYGKFDTDYSWHGLMRKGFRIEHLTVAGWQPVITLKRLEILIQNNYKLRYKHSIQ